MVKSNSFSFDPVRETASGISAMGSSFASRFGTSPGNDLSSQHRLAWISGHSPPETAVRWRSK